MPGHRVDRFNLAPKARQCASIDQGQGRVVEALLQRLGLDQQLIVRCSVKMPPGKLDRIKVQRKTRGVPGFKAAVEHKHPVPLAQPRQQPPRPRGKCPRTVVIQHHIAVVVDAPPAQTLYQLIGIRQRMTPRDAFGHRATQVAFQVGKLRALDVAFGIAAQPVVRVFKRKAAIQNDQTGLGLAFVQGLRADQLRNGHRELL